MYDTNICISVAVKIATIHRPVLTFPDDQHAPLSEPLIHIISILFVYTIPVCILHIIAIIFKLEKLISITHKY